MSRRRHQIGIRARARAARSEQGTQIEAARARRSAQGAQMEPGKLSGANKQRNRASQGTQERTEHPNLSNQGDIDKTLRLCSEIDVSLHRATLFEQPNRASRAPKSTQSIQIEPARAPKSSEQARRARRPGRRPIEPAGRVPLRESARSLARYISARKLAARSWVSILREDRY